MQEADLPATNAFTECKFLCTNGRCLDLSSLVCDQLDHCGDNSDEENCPVSTQHPSPALFYSELEFVQIIIIIVVMMVMVVVIICLLNHYKLSTWSLMSRLGQARRQEQSLQPEGCFWPSESGSRQGASEVVYAPHPRERFSTPSFLQRDRFSRFQPTYPLLQQHIDLPPTIALSDGEEPPPYQGPCPLQLRNPEQQLELNRESVRAPPNRTVFDSDLMDSHGPCPPSTNTGISAANWSAHGRTEGPPPAYSEVMGHFPGTAFYLHQHSNNQSSSVPTVPGARTRQGSTESTIVLSKAKDMQRGELV
ncbi:low-density lipoprotein receptor class A domain-containing protein 4b isoform X1 [Tachysurus fulvidraco]|uniref:low-density lipoprotein receptor class A domain-containing protein 4b isoform X1 n=1 Tax=Tachysurus fulvidraco TaxID=1234273 RepID=UPI000F4E5DAB|nr:low-density lipoprotein receptor class A domain-containing protein 4b isoform X1 [Tachysurus fulvidraco]XP_027004534.1 low-density lipoprotein receptor class A domain-containing protein 4b isoform X1 [Tachysurus fulvidraco]